MRAWRLVYIIIRNCCCFRSAILNAGYQVSDSHAAKNVLKTDAPAHIVYVR